MKQNHAVNAPLESTKLSLRMAARFAKHDFGRSNKVGKLAVFLNHSQPPSISARKFESVNTVPESYESPQALGEPIKTNEFCSSRIGVIRVHEVHSLF